MTLPGHILIVDDDPDFVVIYRQLLEPRGYVVTAAHSADEAAAALDRDGNAFDVVVLDQRLHGRGGANTGLELIQRIISHAPFANVIVVTGHAAPDAIERAFAEGVYDYLEKAGAFKALLLAKVRNAVELASARRRAALSSEQQATRLAEVWAEVRSEAAPQRKGLLLEELVKLLFSATRGFERVATRIVNDVEEIDIVVENGSEDDYWRNDGSQFFLGECKNWSSRCDRREFDAFYMKLSSRYQRAKTGFFIAPGGFTEAFLQRRREKKNGYVIVPIDAADLERWITADDRAAVLRELHRRAVFDQA